MSNFYYIEKPSVTWEEVFLTPENKAELQHFLMEQKCKHLFQSYKLSISNKLLLSGASGCGKTLTAKALANALNKKILIVNLATIISSKLGETSKNIEQLFKEARYDELILFLDEFDSLALTRTDDSNDNSEMKRVVNAIIQLMDYFAEKSILIAATNQIELIDEALKRRFNHHILYKNPNKELLDKYYEQLRKPIPEKYLPNDYLYEVSFAVAKNDFEKKVKQHIITEYLAHETK